MSGTGLTASRFLQVGFLISGALLVSACDSGPEAGSPKERTEKAFEEKLEGCAAVAETLGGIWTMHPVADMQAALGGEPPEGLGSIRIIRPGMAVTKDYRPNRLNIDLDDEDRVTRVYCG
tara:strand:+ start:381774 stop:382133 length:360 start_codon:yes stop_codon:yes gene_type:complete